MLVADVITDRIQRYGQIRTDEAVSGRYRSNDDRSVSVLVLRQGGVRDGLSLSVGEFTCTQPTTVASVSAFHQQLIKRKEGAKQKEIKQKNTNNKKEKKKKRRNRKHNNGEALILYLYCEKHCLRRVSKMTIFSDPGYDDIVI